MRLLIVAVLFAVPVSAQPFIPFLAWPVSSPRITQDYGTLDCIDEDPGFHSGLDITAANQSCATADVIVRSVAGGGVVYRTQTGCASGPNEGPRRCQHGFGNHVIVEHSSSTGSYFVTYAHLRFLSVAEGNEISTGEAIGIMGDTGVDGCHLHFDILAFNPGSPGTFAKRDNVVGGTSEPLGMGYFAYNNETFPSIGCAGSSKICLDPKLYFPREPVYVGFSSDRQLYERPSTSSVQLGGSAIDLVPGQGYISIYSTSSDWHYIMLPSEKDSAKAPCADPHEARAVFGWFHGSEPSPHTFEPPPVQVQGARLAGGHLNVRSTPGGAEIARVWGNHAFGETGEFSPPSNGCEEWWTEIFLPISRASSLCSSAGNQPCDRGWVCGDFLVDQGGQCTAPASIASNLRRITAASCGPGTSPPAVDTVTALNVTSATAELRLSVTPGGLDTEAWFTWDDDNTPSIETARFNVGSGTTSQTYGHTIGSLQCETTYFFRAHALNSAGGDQGSVLSFTTASCSGGGGSGSTEELLFNGDFESGGDNWVTDGDFYVDAAPNPRGGNYYAFLSNPDWTSGNNLSGAISQVVVDIPSSASSARLSFYYSISTSETTSSTIFDRLRVRVTRFGGTTSTLHTLSNLDATGTSYSRREYDLSNYAGSSINLEFVAETDSTLPTTFRLDDVSLLAEVPAGGPPSVSTNSADQITENSARLNLSVNPNGLSTSVWFDWDDDTNLSFETSPVGLGSATSTQSVSISLFDLGCDTTYYFAAVAQNDAGSDTGSQRSFTTNSCPGGPPSADTDPAIDVTSNSAVLTAEILPNGRSTEAWFDWGTSTSLGTLTSRVGVGSSQSWQFHQQSLSNLECGTTYYFEAHAENSGGADDGATLSFTTSGCGGGGGEPPQGFFAWAHRQGCHGNHPAILLEWSPAANVSQYTVERLDGAYSAQVDASSDGLAHLVAGGFVYGQSYSFRVLAEGSSGTTTSNSVTVYVVDQECVIAGQPNTPPGPFIPWLEPPTCENGSPTVELQWTEAAGAESYTLVRHADSKGIKRTVSNLQGTGFVDSANIVPGAGHAYVLDAINAGGVTGAQRHLDFYPRPDLCGDAGLPGDFVVTAGEPYCANGEPTVPITWTASSGADDFYRVRALADGAFTGGSGFSTNSYPFAYEFTSGVRPGFIHQLYMVSFGSSDETKTRYSNSVFLAVPKDVCGPLSLAPDASTRTAVGVDETGAILRGSVHANGSPTTAYFEWGTSASYGEQTPPVAVGDAMIFVRPSAQLSDLSCGTEYHFRLVASNAHGVVVGSDASFLTADCPMSAPLATTGAVVPIPPDLAVLYGAVSYSHLPAETWFEWGQDVLDSSGHRYSLPSGGSHYSARHYISFLNCGTTYRYRLLAENEYGRSSGEIREFTTETCPDGELEIFSDSFESGSYDRWSAHYPENGTGLNLTATAAHDGALGLEIAVQSCSDNPVLALADQVIGDTQVFKACQQISAEDVTIASGGDATFLAGDRIALGSGFSVANGARFQAGASRPEFGPWYVEDSTAQADAPYWTQFAIEASDLVIEPGAIIDILVAYNLQGQPLFRVGLFFDETAGLPRTRFELRSQNHSTWVLRHGPLVDDGFQVFRFLWRTSSVETTYARADLCVLTATGQGCSYQYHNLIDAVDLVRWGVVRYDGNIAGRLKMDDFVSGRHKP